jgi:hypothetical protein
MTLRNGRFIYEIRREGDSGVYSVSDGQRTIVVPILAAAGYGLGTVGQTYVFEYQGFFFESEVTYYDQIHKLDITLAIRIQRLPFWKERSASGCLGATSGCASDAIQRRRSAGANSSWIR